MLARRLLLPVVLAPVAILGCAGSSSDGNATPTPTAVPTPTPIALPAALLYFGSRDSVVYGYRLDEASGELAALNTSQARGTYLVEHPSGFSVYGYAYDSKRIISNRVDTWTGALASVPGAPDLPVWFVWADPGGDLLYTLDCAGSPCDTRLLRVFRLDRASGAILGEAAGSPFDLGAQADEVLVHPSGNFIYSNIGDYPGALAGFRVDRAAGTLVPIPGSPFTGVLAGHAQSVVFHPGLPLAFMAEVDAIATVRIDDSTGALSLASRVSVDPFIHALALDPVGGRMYVSITSSTISAIRGFAVDQSSGRLTSTPVSVSSASSPFAELFLHPSGRLLLALQEDSFAAGPKKDRIGAFSLDPQTGALSEISGSPFSLSDEVYSFPGIAPRVPFLGDGRWAIVPGREKIHRFEVSVTPPTLTKMEPLAVPPASVAVCRVGSRSGS